MYIFFLILYRLPVLPLPKNHRLALQQSLSKLLWGGGRPMVRRQVCCQHPRNGGLGMPDLENHWFAERLAFLGWSLSNDTVLSVTANWLKSQNGTLFSHVWRRGRLALDPLQNKSCSEFFSQAYKNWHITWGNNLGPDWPPLAKGFQISHYHTPTRPLNFFPLDNRRIRAYRS